MTLPAYLPKGILGRVGLFASWFLAGGLPATLVVTNAGPPVSGTSGTGVGYVSPGQLLIDTTNSVLYMNVGTTVSPTWASLGGSGLETQTIATGLIASTTHTLAGALALTAKINRVTTAAGSGDAVKLAALTPGQSQTIYNDGASPIAVFPAASGVAIDGGSVGASVTLTNAKRCLYTCTAANVIESAQLGVASA